MRAVLLAAALAALAGPTSAEERVLYCIDTSITGFVWQEGQTEGQYTNFKPDRYVVKVLSETKRTITKVTGPTITWTITCREVGAYETKLFACNSDFYTSPWVFRGDKFFVHADMYGPPVSDGDEANIGISYGTCTGF